MSEAKDDQDAKDAERYRWLRNSAVGFMHEYNSYELRKPSPWCVLGLEHSDASPLHSEKLDAAIDAAISAATGSEQK